MTSGLNRPGSRYLRALSSQEVDPPSAVPASMNATVIGCVLAGKIVSGVPLRWACITCGMCKITDQDLNSMSDLRNFFRKQRGELKISRGAPFCVDGSIHALDLLWVDARVFRHFRGADPVILSEETQVHALEGNGEVEFLLRLWQRKGVGCGGSLLNLFGNIQIGGQLIDLRFVKMGDGFKIGRAVAILDKKPLVIFQAVGRSRDRKLKPVCMKVLEHLAGALLKVACSNDLRIGLRGKPNSFLDSFRR